MSDKNKKLRLSGFIASGLGWYDYTIVGFLSSTLATVFFPNTGKVLGLILTFSVFALAYFIRPIGGLFFGWLADKHSLKQAYRLSLLGMAMPAIFIAILPVSLIPGEVALIIFIILRLIQGISVGGEFPTLMLYLHRVSDKKKVFYTSFIVASAVTGLMLGTLVVTILHYLLNDQQMVEYGWRIGFIIAAIFALLVYFIQRYALVNVPVSRHLVTRKNPSIFNKEKILNILTLLFVIGFIEFAFYASFVWFPVYLTHFDILASDTAFIITTSALLLSVVLTLIFAHRIKPVHTLNVLRLGILLSTVFFILLINVMHAHVSVIFIATLFLAVAFSLVQAVVYYVLCELTSIFRGQCKVLGFTFSIAVALFGSTAPVVCTTLLSRFSVAGIELVAGILGVLAIAISFFANINKNISAQL